MAISFDFHDTIKARLKEEAGTYAQRAMAIDVLYEIIRHLKWESCECAKVAADLVDICGIKQANISTTLKLLEQVGAIHRVKKGRLNVICVTPEGAFRGDINNHAVTVEKFALQVIDGGKESSDQVDDQIDIEDYISEQESNEVTPPPPPNCK